MEFNYSARDTAGQLVRGTIEAPHEEEAVKRLRDRTLIVIHLRLIGRRSGFGWPKRSVPLRDRMLLTQELALMIKASIPLARALTDLEDQTTNRLLRDILRTTATDIRGGMSFSDALRKHPAAFPPLMVAMIHSGEVSGKLVEILERLAEQMEKDANLRGKLQSALIYPIVLVIAMSGVMTLVILFIVPQLKKIFDDVGVALPLMTRVLLRTADLLRHDGLIILSLLIGLVIATGLALRQPGPRRIFDRFKLQAPIFGALSQKISIARFATTVATLLAAGLPLLETLRISQAVIGNRYYEEEVARIARAAEAGQPLAETMRAGRILPRMVSNLIAVGEESGSLDATFGTIATFYDREVETTTRNLTTLLEPALMIAMGVAIGFLVSAVLMPIYKLVQAL